MLRVDEQEGSRAWCREEIEREERNRGGGVGGGRREEGYESQGQDKQGTEAHRAWVCKETVPPVCSEDLRRTGLCVTVSEAAKGMAEGTGQNERELDKARTRQDTTGQDRSGRVGSGQDSR